MKNLTRKISYLLITLFVLFIFSCNSNRPKYASYESLNIKSSQSLCKDVMSVGSDMFMDVASYDSLLVELRKSKNVGVFIDSLCGGTIDANSQYLKMIGYSLKEIKSLTYQQLTPEKWHQMESDLLAKVLIRGRTGIYEKEYIRKDGSVFPVRIETWLILNEKNVPDRLLSLVWDKSQSK
ncbi:MAG: PAS domain S-box protein [Bacteroidales bacterium]|nr:PAS domain S-box protein [Bacteroidales bacterium]